MEFSFPLLEHWSIGLQNLLTFLECTPIMFAFRAWAVVEKVPFTMCSIAGLLSNRTPISGTGHDLYLGIQFSSIGTLVYRITKLSNVLRIYDVYILCTSIVLNGPIFTLCSRWFSLLSKRTPESLGQVMICISELSFPQCLHACCCQFMTQSIQLNSCR